MALEGMIRVDKREAQATRQLAAYSGFAGARQAYQYQQCDSFSGYLHPIRAF
jgi:hypothetical protein